jgi:hypothetical protein
MIVAADAADPACDKMRVAGVFAFHENAIAAKYRGRAVALGNSALSEIDFGVNAQASDDTSDGVPRHLDQIAGLMGLLH